MQVRVRRSVIEAIPTPSPLIIEQLPLGGIFMVSMFFVVMMSNGKILMVGCGGSSNSSGSSSSTDSD